MRLTRRQAVVAVAAAAVTLYGKDAVAKQDRYLVLPLDGLGGIQIQYRGRRITISPDEIMAALSGKENT